MYSRKARSLPWYVLHEDRLQPNLHYWPESLIRDKRASLFPFSSVSKKKSFIILHQMGFTTTEIKFFCQVGFIYFPVPMKQHIFMPYKIK